MGSIRRRNPPNAPEMKKFDAEILHSPYKGVEVEGNLLLGLQMSSYSDWRERRMSCLEHQVESDE